MRTVSQSFADAVRSGNTELAQQYIQRYGMEQTRAVFWLSLQSQIDPSWATFFQQPSADAGSAVLLMLANPNYGDVQNQIVAALTEHLNEEWFSTKHPFHHAAYHGNHQAFSVLSEKYQEKTGKAFNWNSEDDEGNTPLYHALSQTHLDTTAAVLMNGGLPTHQVKHQKGTTSVLNKVFAEKQGMLGYIKQIWHSASDKASIKEAVDGSGSKVKSKKKKM